MVRFGYIYLSIDFTNNTSYHLEKYCVRWYCEILFTTVVCHLSNRGVFVYTQRATKQPPIDWSTKFGNRQGFEALQLLCKSLTKGVDSANRSTSR